MHLKKYIWEVLLMSKLTREEKSWIYYDWANSAYSMTVTSTILPLFFKAIADQAGISGPTSTAYWGYANSISTIVLSLLAPILGTIADYKNFKKRFFVFFLGLGLAFTTLLATVPNKSWGLLLFFYIFSVIGFSGTNIFYDAFLVDVTSEDKMDTVSTRGYAMGYIGSTIPFIICIAIVFLAQKSILPISLYDSYKISFVLTSLWWGLFTIPMLKHVKQIHYIEPESKPILNSFKRIAKTLSNIKQHKTIFLFLLAYFFYIDGVDTIIKMATSYGADLGIDTLTLLLVLLVTQFVAFPCAIIYGKLSQKFKEKKMIYVAILIYTFICIYAYFLNSALDFWILAILVGTSQGGIQALSRSYFGRLVPKQNSNEFFGFYNIFGKFAAIMGPALVGFFASTTGKTNNGVFSLIILFLIGGIILLKVPD
jgi:UMF1 family MFS transporter